MRAPGECIKDGGFLFQASPIYESLGEVILATLIN